MPYITWNDDFVLGIEQFDQHHKHLISLINETTRCLDKGAPHEEITVVLNSLVDYAWYHFNAEEQWMKNSSYPELADHEKTHRDFSKSITEMRERLLENSRTVVAELSAFLNFWLIDHIVICDSKYATFAGTRKEDTLMI
jgi:hemerythrin